MLNAPGQNWSLYESLARDADAAWAQKETPPDRLAFYASLFNLILQRRQADDAIQRLEQRQWETKLAIRQKMVAALAKSDQRRSDRSSPDNSA
jgi:hypothetical protein